MNQTVNRYVYSYSYYSGSCDLRKKIIILHNFCSAVWLDRLCSDITSFVKEIQW